MKLNEHTLSPEDLGIEYFSVAELRGWWYKTDPRWFICADMLREYSGLVIRISPVNGAIGRDQGADGKSDHNYTRWGRVFGIDTMPVFSRATEDGSVESQAYTFYQQAQWCGFTSIGYYPDWKDADGSHSPGFHLGTRRDRRPGNPATWGGLRDLKGGSKYKYTSIIDALHKTPERIA